MSLDTVSRYAAPEDWRAYSGTLIRRVIAFCVDYVLIAILIVPAAVVLFLLGIPTLGLAWYLFPGLGLIVAALYFGFSIGGASQASPGMRMMGVMLVRVDGRKIDFVTAMVHLILFWVLNSVLTPLILLAGLFTDRSRLIHDLLVGTAAIRTL
ncbi:RDD family protein [Allorhizobium borbori]|uniref:Putative RDD family membrane protein YckC n=1 Tax=Allorhizobium borbori TaxID=485907 RepID=A0A7W6K290_9HYPH|nr:RDD family protein [Allorhizobium borbori]MBB4102737.1 putative RDD family membrane protein YckC [Allorhizobium borbori]PZU22428.1 MAG: RDD family protein [Shinella sp.]